jgi:anthranilate synthase component 2
MSVVIIDNSDSFTYNIAHYVALAGHSFRVLGNNTALTDITATNPTHLILSPGPGNVDDASSYGVSAAALEYYAARIPVLGVCLGHQLIGKSYGAAVRRLPIVRHGWVSKIRQTGLSTLFTGVTEVFTGMRYHSYVVDAGTLPKQLRITALSEEDGEIMALQHEELTVFGVQFHPESIGTDEGLTIIRNFLGATRKWSDHAD